MSHKVIMNHKGCETGPKGDLLYVLSHKIVFINSVRR